jgi:hypothetical protein
MSITTTLWAYLRAFWDTFKQVFVSVVRWTLHVVDWFKDQARLVKMRANHHLMAVSLKASAEEIAAVSLEKGEYAVVNCLFNRETNTIDVDNVQVVAANDLDGQTATAFRTSDLIVFN